MRIVSTHNYLKSAQQAPNILVQCCYIFQHTHTHTPTHTPTHTHTSICVLARTMLEILVRAMAQALQMVSGIHSIAQTWQMVCGTCHGTDIANGLWYVPWHRHCIRGTCHGTDIANGLWHLPWHRHCKWSVSRAMAQTLQMVLWYVTCYRHCKWSVVRAIAQALQNVTSSLES